MDRQKIVHSPVESHLDGFQFFATVDKGNVNIYVPPQKELFLR